MHIQRLDSDSYRRAFPHPGHIYNSVQFSELNRGKCDDVLYLALYDGGRLRCGMIAGERDGAIMSPWSAPFGGLTVNRRQSFRCIDNAVKTLCTFTKSQERSLVVTLPPEFYGDNAAIKCAYSLMSTPGIEITPHLNYAADLTRHLDPVELMSPKSRWSIGRALMSHYTITRQPAIESEITRNYNLILANHNAKGRELRMSLHDFMATAPVAGSDFFIMTFDGIDIAAAQLHHAAPGIVQLINWGDLPLHHHPGAMNLLALHIMRHYKAEGARMLDFGPVDSCDGVNEGLSKFKESLGCTPSLKYTFRLS